jgi:hypothetical protein
MMNRDQNNVNNTKTVTKDEKVVKKVETQKPIFPSKSTLSSNKSNTVKETSIKPLKKQN